MVLRNAVIPHQHPRKPRLEWRSILYERVHTHRPIGRGQDRKYHLKDFQTQVIRKITVFWTIFWEKLEWRRHKANSRSYCPFSFSSPSNIFLLFCPSNSSSFISSSLYSSVLFSFCSFSLSFFFYQFFNVMTRTIVLSGSQQIWKNKIRFTSGFVGKHCVLKRRRACIWCQVIDTELADTLTKLWNILLVLLPRNSMLRL
jgi:hypothetical protein